ELLCLCRLWNIYFTDIKSKQNHWEENQISSTLRWDLLERAAVTEGKFEALLIKIASERQLNDSDVKILGIFREICQTIRESIRDYREVPWDAAEAVNYKTVKLLSSSVGCLLASEHPWKKPSVQSSVESLLLITRSSPKDRKRHNWKDDWKALNSTKQAE